jgi:hypothetical protein
MYRLPTTEDPFPGKFISCIFFFGEFRYRLAVNNVNGCTDQLNVGTTVTVNRRISQVSSVVN